MFLQVLKLLCVFILSISLLWGGSGIGVFMHYCKGELVETTLYVNHSCEHDSTPISNENEGCAIEKKCCEDESFVLKTQDYKKSELLKIPFDKQFKCFVVKNEDFISSFKEASNISRGPPIFVSLFGKTAKFIVERRLLI